MQWDQDDAHAFVVQKSDLEATIFRVDLVSGKRQVWKQIRPADPAGILSITSFFVTPSGNAYSYSHERLIHSMYTRSSDRVHFSPHSNGLSYPLILTSIPYQAPLWPIAEPVPSLSANRKLSRKDSFPAQWVPRRPSISRQRTDRVRTQLRSTRINCGKDLEWKGVSRCAWLVASRRAGRVG